MSLKLFFRFASLKCLQIFLTEKGFYLKYHAVILYIS